MGLDVRLSCSAGDHAWLMTLSEERATELVARRGFGAPQQYATDFARGDVGGPGRHGGRDCLLEQAVFVHNTGVIYLKNDPHWGAPCGASRTA